MSKQEELEQILQKMRGDIPEITGALIASVDGLAIAYSLSNGVDPNRVAAMTATALGLGKRITETLGAGLMSETSVVGSQGQIYVYAAGGKGVLAVIAPSNANVGLIHLEARDAAKRVAAAL
jgi:predicted regulator of Ras-like GTPase activity (Roadblock/LC7/MglB family)